MSGKSSQFVCQFSTHKCDLLEDVGYIEGGNGLYIRMPFYESEFLPFPKFSKVKETSNNENLEVHLLILLYK